ncbi:MAG: SH3 domain-containing protein [Anaerolineae bacterium]|nr:SH3 domain-containing protein [Anaerolineae bacterium]
MWIERVKIWKWLCCAGLIGVLAVGCSPDIAPAPTARLTPEPIATPLSPTPGPTATPRPVPTKPIALSDAPTPTPSATLVFSRQGDILALPTFTPSPTSIAIRCTVSGDASTLREGPGADYQRITTLPPNQVVSARKCSPGGQWLLVETGQQEVGWLAAAGLNCQADPATLPIARGVVAPTRPTPTLTPSSPATPTPVPSPTTPPDTWRGEYYDNPSLLGEPVLIREDPELDFNWILDSPAPGIPADNFSVRWTKVIDFFEGGDYRFFAEADDGLRLYLDGWLVIDAWHTFLGVPYVGDFSDVGPGLHTVVVEYFESGGHAKIKVWAEKTRFSDTAWQGEYYNNSDWQEPVFLVRYDENLDFHWGQGAPADGMNRDHFSVRWRRTYFFETGDYKFFAEIDDKDGVKIYLDGWLLADGYREDDGAVSGYFANVGAGYHEVTVEYHDKDDDAKIKVWWEKD